MDEKKLKKFLTRFKKMINSIDKYEISSPCLLNILQHKRNGDLEFILSHRDTRNQFLGTKALSIDTQDEFCVNTELEGYDKIYHLDCENIRYSPTIVVSSRPIKYLHENQGDYIQSESVYFFPKMMLNIIANEAIYDVNFELKPNGTNKIKFDFDESVKIKFSLPFVINSSKLDNIFSISTFPIGVCRGQMKDMFVNRYDGCDNVLIYDGDTLTELLEENREVVELKLRGQKDFVRVYPVDFIKIKPIHMELTSKLTEPDRNIITAILTIESKDVCINLLYRYIDV